ncbi:hypothetical protein BMS3Bbin04_01843 [bacterium BMS3Bbin04]|nr:hypothetical protein BMS3Bbin04_01843 [bacterium BMS3Bbin04]
MFAVLTLPDEGNLVLGRGVHVAVKRIEHDVGFSTHEPFEKWCFGIVEDSCPRLVPFELRRSFFPECDGIFQGFVSCRIPISDVGIGNGIG